MTHFHDIGPERLADLLQPLPEFSPAELDRSLEAECLVVRWHVPCVEEPALDTGELQ